VQLMLQAASGVKKLVKLPLSDSPKSSTTIRVSWGALYKRHTRYLLGLIAA
jgi:hypothetical protein